VEQACDRLVVLGDGKLLLETSIAAAKRTFGLVDADQGAEVKLIGSFSGPDGRAVGLTAEIAKARPASLEEIVLGHLAAGRSRDASYPSA
jgi:hypothetical protein